MNQSSPIRPPDRQRVDEQIAASIADAILDGVFAPGSTLPPERDLAEQLGVNRTSLRQGLARLQQMGLIEARQGSGNLVRDPEGLTHPAVVEALVRKLGPEFLVELLEIRAALGPAIGRLAAERHTPEDAEALRAALAAVQEADSGPGAPGRGPRLLPCPHPQHPQPRVGVAVSLGRARLRRPRARAHRGLRRRRAGGGRPARGSPRLSLKRDAAGAAAAVEAYLRASALRMVECYRRGAEP